jgi:capsular polysaccharide transport system permease protein
MVVEHLTSRQAVDELQTRINVRALYARPEAYWWARFNPSLPMEDFLGYWHRMVTATYDHLTGAASVRVRAFAPENAQLVANMLVALSEELVNKIGARAHEDALRLAEAGVRRAEERLKAARAAMTEFRNREGFIDPSASVISSNAALTQALRATLSQLENDLATLQVQQLQPNSPVIRALQARIKTTRQQLADAEAEVANERQGNRPLSALVLKHEQLELVPLHSDYDSLRWGW